MLPYQISSKAAYEKAYQQSLENPENFWAEVASHFTWQKPFKQVLEWDFSKPEIKWFPDGQLNISENCLDRHIAEKADKPALIWEPNNPNEDAKTYTYRQLLQEVMLAANILKSHGVQRGDRVCIYMGMVPELAIAMLACTRIGAIHSVIFGGFSASSIADRVQDAGAVCLITCDGAHRGAKTIALKAIVDEALAECPTIKTVLVVNRLGSNPAMQEGRDYWWHSEVENLRQRGETYCAPEIMNAEDPLFILYTSGSTGKPKGVVHTSAGYLIWAAYTFANVFQIKPNDIHFCTADIGWITGHSYIVYGPLATGTTSLMFEGIPTWPTPGRYWDIVAKHAATIFYTSPTAIRSLMSYGLEPLRNKNLSSLRVLGSVGEPINEEAWHWLHSNVGKGRLPVVDTWWQTETGGIMISNLAGITDAKPGFATLPLPGVQPLLLDENGKVLEGNNVSGNLCIAAPWPGMVRTTWGDADRFRKAYFSTYPGYYFTGDGCLRNADGLYRITGRVDDVLNVSGHRLGTAELENAINSLPGVVESAVAGYAHPVKGQGIYAYVVTDDSLAHADESKVAIFETVVRQIGPIARPDVVQFVTALPKTRSGKIMRRILRKIADGDTENPGDVTTLLNPEVVAEIARGRGC